MVDNKYLTQYTALNMSTCAVMYNVASIEAIIMCTIIISTRVLILMECQAQCQLIVVMYLIKQLMLC